MVDLRPEATGAVNRFKLDICVDSSGVQEPSAINYHERPRLWSFAIPWGVISKLTSRFACHMPSLTWIADRKTA